MVEEWTFLTGIHGSTSMAMTIREARAQDIAALAGLCAQVHALHVAWRPETFRPASSEEMEALFRDWLGLDGYRAYLAVEDGRPVGYIVARVVDRPGNVLMHPRRFLDVEQIGVVPEMRRRGVGRALIQKAREFALERGLRRIELNVWAENAEARRAFESWGFQALTGRMTLAI
jgi:ribosomal protein S18 acetylase RimI-like enzyme